MSNAHSVVQCGGYSKSFCGYCEGKNTGRSFGMWATSLSVQDYQTMINAGWRRSGDYLYRPDIARSCCPSYTIRLHASSFTPSASQKRVLKRLRKYSKEDERGASAGTEIASVNKQQQSRGKKHMRDSSDGAAPLVVEEEISAFGESVSLKQSSRQGNPSTSLSVSQQSAPERHESNSSEQSSAASVETDTLRGEVLSAVLNALRELVSKEPNEEAFQEQLVSAAAPEVKVTIPGKWNMRKSRKKRPSNPEASRRSISDDRTEDGKGRRLPHFSSNVALVLASAERRLAMEAQSASLSLSTEPNVSSTAPVKRRTKPNFVTRQMEVGHIVLQKLQNLCSKNDSLFANVELASPGFINVWVRERKRGSSGLLKNLAIQLPSSINAPSMDVNRAQDVMSMPIFSNSHQREHSPPPHSSASVPFKSGPFTTELVPARFDAESFQIYRRYQTTVHREKLADCNRNSYVRFLVNSPLVRVPGREESDLGYGSFHVLYKLGGRLFAVGVVDILPECLSSVYLFYDPDFKALSPGVLSALKEIEWVQKETLRKPELRFYYMGYYIHTCKKMSYKASYVPSEILCHETRRWIPAADAIQRLNTMGNNLTRLAPPGIEPAHDIGDYTITHEEAVSEARAAILQLAIGHRMSLSDLQLQFRNSGESALCNLRELIAKFVQLVGRTQSHSFVFDIAPLFVD